MKVRRRKSETEEESQNAGDLQCVKEESSNRSFHKNVKRKKQSNEKPRKKIRSNDGTPRKIEQKISEESTDEENEPKSNDEQEISKVGKISDDSSDEKDTVIIVKFASDSDEEETDDKKKSEREETTKRKRYPMILVNNLNEKTAESTLKDTFSKFGTVVNVYLSIKNKKQGTNAGYAYVEYGNDCEVEETLKHTNIEIDDNIVQIEKGGRNGDRFKRNNERVKLKKERSEAKRKKRLEKRLANNNKQQSKDMKAKRQIKGNRRESNKKSN